MLILSFIFMSVHIIYLTILLEANNIPNQITNKVVVLFLYLIDKFLKVFHSSIFLSGFFLFPVIYFSIGISRPSNCVLANRLYSFFIILDTAFALNFM